jgi:hypothetical protein
MGMGDRTALGRLCRQPSASKEIGFAIDPIACLMSASLSAIVSATTCPGKVVATGM